MNRLINSVPATAILCAMALSARHAYGEDSKGPAAASDISKGKALYALHCSACHQGNGEGLPGVFPPLEGSGVVNKADATKHLRVVFDGAQGAKAGGVLYASAMPPFAGVLGDIEIANIVNYERSAWGNHGRPISVAQVAAERTNSRANAQR